MAIFMLCSNECLVQLLEKFPLGLRFLNPILSNKVNILYLLYYVIIALQASSEYTDEKVDLEVYLINGKKVTLKVEAFDRTDQVLEVCIGQLSNVQIASF